MRLRSQTFRQARGPAELRLSWIGFPPFENHKGWGRVNLEMVQRAGHLLVRPRFILVDNSLPRRNVGELRTPQAIAVSNFDVLVLMLVVSQ